MSWLHRRGAAARARSSSQSAALVRPILRAAALRLDVRRRRSESYFTRAGITFSSRSMYDVLLREMADYAVGESEKNHKSTRMEWEAKARSDTHGTRREHRRGVSGARASET